MKQRSRSKADEVEKEQKAQNDDGFSVMFCGKRGAISLGPLSSINNASRSCMFYAHQAGATIVLLLLPSWLMVLLWCYIPLCSVFASCVLSRPPLNFDVKRLGSTYKGAIQRGSQMETAITGTAKTNCGTQKWEETVAIPKND